MIEKTRADAVKLITAQLRADYNCPRSKGHRFHYGAQELRELMDYLYGGPPESDDEKIPNPSLTI